MRHIGHERQIVAGRPLERVNGTAGAFLPQILHDLEREGEDLDVGFVVVEFDVAGAAVPVDVADRARQAAGTGNRRGAAEKVAKFHGQEDRGASRVVERVVDPLRNRQLQRAIGPEAPAVAVDITGVEPGVGECVAVPGVLVRVDEPGRQHRRAAAVEHGGARKRRAHSIEFPHGAQAAVEADVYALVRSASLREQDLGADDQAGRAVVLICRRREGARRTLSVMTTVVGDGGGSGAHEEGQQDYVAATVAPGFSSGCRHTRHFQWGPAVLTANKILNKITSWKIMKKLSFPLMTPLKIPHKSRNASNDWSARSNAK